MTRAQGRVHSRLSADFLKSSFWTFRFTPASPAAQGASGPSFCPLWSPVGSLLAGWFFLSRAWPSCKQTQQPCHFSQDWVPAGALPVGPRTAVLAGQREKWMGRGVNDPCLPSTSVMVVGSEEGQQGTLGITFVILGIHNLTGRRAN